RWRHRGRSAGGALLAPQARRGVSECSSRVLSPRRDFAEATERDIIFQHGSRSDAAIGANGNARADRCALDNRPPDAGTGPNPGVDNLDAWPDDCALLDYRVAAEVALRMDDGVGRDDD